MIYVPAMNLRRLQRDSRFPDWVVCFWMPLWGPGDERIKGLLTPTLSSSPNNKTHVGTTHARGSLAHDEQWVKTPDAMRRWRSKSDFYDVETKT